MLLFFQRHYSYVCSDIYLQYNNTDYFEEIVYLFLVINVSPGDFSLLAFFRFHSSKIDINVFSFQSISKHPGNRSPSEYLGPLRVNSKQNHPRPKIAHGQMPFKLLSRSPTSLVNKPTFSRLNHLPISLSKKINVPGLGTKNVWMV